MSATGTLLCIMGFFTYLLWSAFIGSIAAVTIYGVINYYSLKQELEKTKQRNGDDSIYLEITKIQPNTVSAKAYGRNGFREDMEFESSDGVRDLRVGQKIY